MKNSARLERVARLGLDFENRGERSTVVQVQWPPDLPIFVTIQNRRFADLADCEICSIVITELVVERRDVFVQRQASLLLFRACQLQPNSSRRSLAAGLAARLEISTRN